MSHVSVVGNIAANACVYLKLGNHAKDVFQVHIVCPINISRFKNLRYISFSIGDILVPKNKEAYESSRKLKIAVKINYTERRKSLY